MCHINDGNEVDLWIGGNIKEDGQQRFGLWELIVGWSLHC